MMKNLVRVGVTGGALPALAFLILFAFPQTSGAQSPPASQPAAASRPTPKGDASRLERLERELRELRATVKKQDATIEGLQETTQDAEAEKLAALQSGTGSKPLQIYGFFDVMFHRLFIKEGTFFKGLTLDKSSFLLNRLNVYLGKQLSESFSALIELRFTFSPLGHVESLGAPEFGLEYERVDTTYKDPYSAAHYRVGGVIIERAYATYQPLDAFGVHAGYFLSPFGIWNEDHGSPVVIPARQPFVVLSAPIPLAQLGLQVFGRFFPSTHTTLDYALTVSNGRGPMDTVFDLDDNKALGARLKLGYQKGDLRLAVDAYGYWGKYTDDAQQIVSYLPFEAKRIRTNAYTETAIATSFLLQWSRLHWQSELVAATVRFDVRPPRDQGQVGLVADYNKMHAYGLLAYTLPLEKWLGSFTLRPYMLFEYEVRDDTYDLSKGVAVTYGINARPLTGVTLKAEVFSFYLVGDLRPGHQFWGLTTQLAVAF